jgi:hypothetical protein
LLCGPASPADFGGVNLPLPRTTGEAFLPSIEIFHSFPHQGRGYLFFISLYYCSAKSLIFVKHPENKIDGFVKRRNSIEGVIPAKAGIQLFQYVLDPGFRRGDDPRDFLRDGQVQITFGFESLNLIV